MLQTETTVDSTLTHRRPAEPEQVPLVTATDATPTKPKPKFEGYTVSYMLWGPVTFVKATWHIFSGKKFRVHRLWGIVYLACWAYACWGHFSGAFANGGNTDVFWVMPIVGWIQTVIACRTFTFLPKAKKDDVQGYYHETKAMSYDFIMENLFFAGLLLFQSVYLCWSVELRSNPAFLPFEILGTFFPYYTVRNLVPKSSFRDSTKTGNKYAMVVKVFYCIAKHMSGYYVNYLCFLGKFGPSPIVDYALLRNLMLLGGWGTTIAMFLQTLKFRKYIGYYAAMILYAGSFPFFYACYAALFYVAQDYLALTFLAFAGLYVNFQSRNMQIAYQCFMCALLMGARYEMLPEAVQTLF
jgi:hypothetical protein